MAPTVLIDATLDLLTPEELADAPRFVEVWERAGYMSTKEAAAGRERIAIWRRFGRGNRQGIDNRLTEPDDRPRSTTAV